ncbi:MAG: phenylacetate--CoA ligase [Deltaproteobacteria bacterium]|nr:phenylacetate--CoA ligase [Deltaproteobacteria bacterium]
MSNYFNEFDTISPQKLREIQNERLRALVDRCYREIPYYQKLFDQNGIKPKHIQTTEDLAIVPFTEKKDLRALYPYGLLGAPLDRIHRFAASSGTTGVPTLVGFTKKDWTETLREQMGRIFIGMGFRRNDLIYQCAGYGLFMGGPGMDAGAEAIGATIFPAGPGRTLAAIQYLKDIGFQAITTTPSFVSYLVDVAQKNGVDPKKEWKLRTSHIGGEPAAPALRRRVEALMPEEFEWQEGYGITELGGPTVGHSCAFSRESCELHILADHYFVEVIDRATGKRLEPGKEGELVVTTLTREATPLIRWRTRDVSAFSVNGYGCSCGRIAHPRIQRITGRTDDVLKVRSTLVFPSQIEDVLPPTKGVGEGWQIVIDRPKDSLDKLTVHAEVHSDIWQDKSQLKAIEEKIGQGVYGRLGMSIEVVLHSPGSLPRYEGKAKRVLDQREFEGGH